MSSGNGNGRMAGSRSSESTDRGGSSGSHGRPVTVGSGSSQAQSSNDRHLPAAVRMYKQLLAIAEEDADDLRGENEDLREENTRLRAEIRELRAAVPPTPSLTEGSSNGDDDDDDDARPPRAPRPRHVARARDEAVNTLRRATIARLEARLRGRLAEYEALVESQSAQIRDLQEALHRAWLISQELVQARQATN